MGDRTEINPSAECLDRWQEGDLHLGGQGRSLSGQDNQTETYRSSNYSRNILKYLLWTGEEYSPTPANGKELSMKCMITSLTVTPPLDVLSIIRLMSWEENKGSQVSSGRSGLCAVTHILASCVHTTTQVFWGHCAKHVNNLVSKELYREWISFGSSYLVSCFSQIMKQFKERLIPGQRTGSKRDDYLTSQMHVRCFKGGSTELGLFSHHLELAYPKQQQKAFF